MKSQSWIETQIETQLNQKKKNQGNLYSKSTKMKLCRIRSTNDATLTDIYESDELIKVEN